MKYTLYPCTYQVVSHMWYNYFYDYISIVSMYSV